MARKPSERRHGDTDDLEDINLIPIMNLIVILIPFLLMISSFIVLGMVDAVAARTGAGSTTKPPDDDKPPFKLTVGVTDEGFRISYPPPEGEVADPGETGDRNFIPKKPGKRCHGNLDEEACKTTKDCPSGVGPGGRALATPCTAVKDYDYTKLNQEILRIKTAYPKEKLVTIIPESDVPFGVLVQVMDFTRERWDKEGAKLRDKIKEATDRKARKKLAEKLYLFPEVSLGTGLSY